MKFKKSHINNAITVLIIALLIIPQTRKPIQVAFHKVIAMFGPSINSDSEKEKLTNYNWQLIDSQGNSFDLESAKGKVVFVNLWATWCPPCIAEMPSMEKLYRDYGEQVVFLFVSSEKQTVTQRFLTKRGMDVPSYLPVSESPAALFSRSIPATFIVGKDGEIHVDKVGAANWNSSGVRKLLDELLAQ